MDPIHSWLDPVQVRKLAEQLAGLHSAPPPADSSSTEASNPPATGEIASPPPASPAAPVTPEQSDASFPHGRLMFRIQRLRDWICRSHPFAGLFILDRDGRVIFDEGDCECLHFLARHATAPQERPESASAANFRVKVGPSATVEIIPADTAAGRLVLGIVVAKPLSPAMAAGISQALVTAAAPPGQASTG